MATGSLSNAGRSQAADGVNALFMSLHTGAPGATGANEVTGGGYTREAVTFPSAVNGVRTATGDPVAAFDGPANQTLHSIGLWSAGTGGTFVGSMALEPGTDDMVFNAAGKYNVTSATITAT